MEKTKVTWEQINDFILTCGDVHDPRDFATTVLQQIQQMVPFDHGRIYFVNGNKNIYDQYLMGVDKKWVTAYFEYYSQVEGGKYDTPLDDEQVTMALCKGDILGVRDWEVNYNDEFIMDYVRPAGIKHSLGFRFYDTFGHVRAIFMLDRTTSVNFSEEELFILYTSVPHFKNLYKNFYIRPVGQQKDRSIEWNSTGLTQREIEIADLLCHGVSPNNISKKLHIAQSTTYKHIAHIYGKMHVSNKQELLVRLLKK